MAWVACLRVCAGLIDTRGVLLDSHLRGCLRRAVCQPLFAGIVARRGPIAADHRRTFVGDAPGGKLRQATDATICQGICASQGRTSCEIIEPTDKPVRYVLLDMRSRRADSQGHPVQL